MPAQAGEGDTPTPTLPRKRGREMPALAGREMLWLQ